MRAEYQRRLEAQFCPPARGTQAAVVLKALDEGLPTRAGAALT
jgi:hypothetical protein